MMEAEYFTEEDKKVLTKCKHDPTLRPGFEYIKCTLIWRDEYPTERMSSVGYELVYDLWIARTGLYYRKFETWPLQVDVNYFIVLWERTKKEVSSWPGFVEKRLYLNPEDQTYYDREMEKVMSGEEF